MKSHHTDHAPAAIGPYSQAVTLDGWVFTAGQIALDPATGELVEGAFEDEVRQVLSNLQAVLEAAGSRFDHVVKATLYLVDMGDFSTLNRLYAEAMGDHRPARTTVAVAELPRGASVEIDFIARQVGLG